MPRINKRMKKASESIERGKDYSLNEALENVDKFPKVKFDETIELHLRLNTDPKNSDQGIRGVVALPHGTGKNIRVAVFCKGELEQKAKDAGADFVGAEDLIEKVNKGFLGFDCVVASPDIMRDLSKLGKILGPRGLMPTPKAGTVTNNVAQAVKEVKAGKIEFKADKQSGIHIGFGKRSFSKDQLLENAKHLIDAINHAKPSSVKGSLIRSVFLSTTMGPSMRIAL